jgi:RimJ/RimL family protein N-acetyltransferase
MPADFRGLYYADDTALIAVVGLLDWTHSTASIHISSDDTARWMTRSFLHEIHNYIFKTCGLTRIHTVALDDNPAVAKVLEGIGYTRECVLKHYNGKHKHAALYAMTFEDWAVSKWNKTRADFTAPNVNTGQQDPKDELNGQEGTSRT